MVVPHINMFFLGIHVREYMCQVTGVFLHNLLPDPRAVFLQNAHLNPVDENLEVGDRIGDSDKVGVKGNS